MTFTHRTGLRSGALIFVIPAGLLIADVALRHAEMSSWRWSRWLAYALAVGVELLGYWLAFALTRHVWKRSPRAALALAAVGSLGIALWLVSSFVCYGVFRWYPTWSDLVFVSEEGGHVAETWSLFVAFVDAKVCESLVAVGVGVFALWHFALQRVASVPARRRDALVTVLCAALLLAPRITMADGVATTPSSSLVISTAQLLRYYALRTRGALHAAQRSPVPRLTASQHRPNVLLLVQESLTRSRMSLYGYPEPTTPRLSAWLRAHAGSEVLFTDATANASNTSISLVTMLTGLSPDASSEQLHRQPFAWQYASAAGYSTFLCSAQSFRYAHFADYFLSTPPDQVWTAEPGVAPIVNGGGTDDELFSEHARAAVTRARATGKPSFGVLQFNDTHFPYRVRPDRPHPFGTDRLGNYQNALLLLDGVLADFLAWLEQTGALEDTVVVLTSDHGESHDGHVPHRTQSYYEDVTGIPMLVHVPASLALARPDAMAALRGNGTRRVQNLDVLPTMLDAMGVLHDPATASLVSELAGRSLFSDVPPDRPVLIVNNNAIRTWANEGFAIARGRQKYVFSERYGEALYELDEDPLERRSLWDPHARPSWLDATLERHPELCALRARHCEPAAGCIPIACAPATRGAANVYARETSR